MDLAHPPETATAPVTAPAQRRREIALLTLGLDTLAIIIAIGSAVTIRFGGGAATVTGFGAIDYSIFSVVLAVGWLISLYLSRAYRHESYGTGTDEFRAVVRATFGVFGALAMISMLTRLDIARGYLAIALPLGLILLLLERAAVRHWINGKRQTGEFCERALIVGTPVEVRYAADTLARNPSAGYRTELVAVIGAPTGRFALDDGTIVENIGPLDDLTELAGRVDLLIVAGQSAVSPQALRQIGWQLEDTEIGLALASSMTDVAGPRIHRRAVEGLPLMSVESPRYSGRKFVVKRALDIAVSLAGLVVLSPVFLVIAALIHLEDRGPVLFRQVRVGVNGETFRMTKFRSMVIDAERRRKDLVSDDTGSLLFKMEHDPRITRVGRHLRSYSLDELPQLLDVLFGHMSLVGPRPPLPEEVRQYETHVRRRLNVKPGITGPWQVGGRSRLTWAESVQKDLYYVENWSVVGDLAILLRTVSAVAKRDGAH